MSEMPASANVVDDVAVAAALCARIIFVIRLISDVIDWGSASESFIETQL